MGKFKVDYQTSKSPAESYAKIKSYLSQEEDIKKIDSKVQCTFNDTAQTCLIAGSQFKADVIVKSQASGSVVEVHVDLPFLLMPFKSKVEEMLKKNLSKHLS